jgi:hypothetical protein
LLQQSDIEAVNSFIDPATGILWAVPINGRPPIQVTQPAAIHPDFKNVLNSSLLMCRTLFNVGVGFEKLVVWAEAADQEEIVDSVLKLQGAVNVSCRCAIEGLENIANARK